MREVKTYVASATLALSLRYSNSLENMSALLSHFHKKFYIFFYKSLLHFRSTYYIRTPKILSIN